ncbi:hypothetical protein DEO72_LG7g2362 [Vigna unguiculata]|uniref:Uncharacterized protein n=1 Tax=Vigna unguiculata TaxID=3917 RepID=A0A4D6MHT6_VIGUN|nr:hypothetical protein DEO72_LG7g2362 [Vigna unguiculata]
MVKQEQATIIELTTTGGVVPQSLPISCSSSPVSMWRNQGIAGTDDTVLYLLHASKSSWNHRNYDLPSYLRVVKPERGNLASSFASESNVTVNITTNFRSLLLFNSILIPLY